LERKFIANVVSIPLTPFAFPGPYPHPRLDYSHVIYRTTHFLRLGVSGGSKAARIASSKTFLRPF